MISLSGCKCHFLKSCHVIAKEKSHSQINIIIFSYYFIIFNECKLILLLDMIIQRILLFDFKFNHE